MPFMLICGGAFLVLVMASFAFAGPSPAKSAQSRRLISVKDRHAHAASAGAMEAQVRKIGNRSDTQMDLDDHPVAAQPGAAAEAAGDDRQELDGRQIRHGDGRHRAGRGGCCWRSRALPILLALFVGLFVGVGLPHMTVGFFIKRRIAKFTAKFPDAIELLVRGLRSGLPITETIGVVGAEVEGPVGEEFRAVSDKMKIGKTMDQALQETSDRLGTPEFQFFVITIAIQRETGGNLAETLANLADVLRKRSQMKLKIRAMSSESKASAYIIGALPFIVFGMIWFINQSYMMNFFIDERLIIAGGGGHGVDGDRCVHHAPDDQLRDLREH